MKKWITGIAALIIICGLAAFAVYRYMEYNKKEAGAGQRVRKSEPVVVNVVLVQHKTMKDERLFSGTTYAWSSFEIDPKVSGKLLSLKFDIGDKINRGDIVGKIDDAEYLQTLHEAEANLAYAKAKLKETEGVAKLKISEYKRQKSLRERQIVSESSYESAESEMQAQLAAAEMCAADVKKCEALLENARIKVSDTVLKAEWTSGSDVRYVGNRYIDEGTLVSTGKPLLSVVELDRIKAYVQIIERDFRFLKVGQTADVTTDAYPDEKFEGTINNIGNVLSDKTRNALAVLSIRNADLKLRPGMFVRVRILLSEHENTQVVPVNAVVNKNNQVGVFCYDAKTKTAKFIPVQTGLSTREEMEILSPKLTMPVVTIGNHLLDNGKEIVISELSRSQLVKEKYEVEGAAPASNNGGAAK